MSILCTLSAVALLLTSPALAAQSSSPAAAVADPARPASDIAHDADRHPAEILALAAIKPGWKVADLMQGSGYFTRLFIASVGPKGHVYAWSPPQFIQVKKALYGDSLDALTAQYPARVTALRMPFADLAFPEALDLAFTSQNYHDLRLPQLPPGTTAAVNAAVFRALKPGGEYLVIDHVGAPNDPTAFTRVHRLDPAIMRQEVEAAGFRFVGESSALRNPADDHTKHVFDPSIRGHTDQVIYLFRKPG